jgi:hypothetical protein
MIRLPLVGTGTTYLNMRCINRQLNCVYMCKIVFADLLVLILCCSALAKGEAGLGGGKAGSAVLRQRCAKLVRLVAGSRAEAAGAAREAGSCATEADGARTVGRLCARQQDRELLELGQSLILYLWRVALAPKRESGGEEEVMQTCQPPVS